MHLAKRMMVESSVERGFLFHMLLFSMDGSSIIMGLAIFRFSVFRKMKPCNVCDQWHHEAKDEDYEHPSFSVGQSKIEI